MPKTVKTRDRRLSTGQVAKVCSVTPDAVLKWIKAGRIKAHRTAGGHYRIDQTELERLRLAPEAEAVAVSSPRDSRQFQYCWEYRSEGGQPISGCRECAVYHMRAHRCYEVMKLAPESGHQKLFCHGACETCDYYLRVHDQETNVLVISSDQILTALLAREAPAAPFNLRSTNCEYSCSALVDSFRPDFVVIDCSLGPERTEDMCSNLLQDPRVPFVKIVLAAKPGEFPKECNRAIFAHIGRPFGVRDIAECIESLRRDDTPRPSGVAPGDSGDNGTEVTLRS
jgi:excisionase family DNA binding protein